MTRIIRVVCCFSLFQGGLLLADQVVLKNGDRLSGKILRFDGKALTLKSDFAGEVTVQWDAVVSLSSEEPLYVSVKEGQVVVGPLVTSGTTVQVATPRSGTVSVPWETITAIRSKAEQQAYETQIERYQNPRLVDLWTGFVDLGFAKTQGNADTSNLTVSANANRATSRDKITVHFTSAFASSDVSGKSVVTANFMRGGVNYSLNVTPKLQAFGSVDLEFDEFQSLDLRFAPAGGIGYHALKTEQTVVDFLGGGSLNREFFSTGLRRTSGEALLGQELTRKFSSSTRVTERLVVFPNFTNRGTYRLNFDTSLVTALRRWLAWQATISDRFLSNPVPGRWKNDILFTTGFRLTFTK
jgi:putative salt-induced outer membrane protein